MEPDWTNDRLKAELAERLDCREWTWDDADPEYPRAVHPDGHALRVICGDLYLTDDYSGDDHSVDDLSDLVDAVDACARYAARERYELDRDDDVRKYGWEGDRE